MCLVCTPDDFRKMASITTNHCRRVHMHSMGLFSMGCGVSHTHTQLTRRVCVRVLIDVLASRTRARIVIIDIIIITIPRRRGPRSAGTEKNNRHACSARVLATHVNYKEHAACVALIQKARVPCGVCFLCERACV